MRPVALTRLIYRVIPSQGVAICLEFVQLNGVPLQMSEEAMAFCTQDMDVDSGGSTEEEEHQAAREEVSTNLFDQFEDATAGVPPPQPQPHKEKHTQERRLPSELPGQSCHRPLNSRNLVLGLSLIHI